MPWNGYAEAKTAAFIDMVNDDLRDLRSIRLAPFYDNAPDVPSDEIRSRRTESSAYRRSNGLSSIGESAFASQIAKGTSKETFIRFVDEMGVEQEYVEDMTSEAIPTALTSMGGLSKAVQILVGQGFELDMDAVRSRFPDIDLPIEEDEVLHINEIAPSTWAEDDSIVVEKLARARVYVDNYLEGGSQ